MPFAELWTFGGLAGHCDRWPPRTQRHSLVLVNRRGTRNIFLERRRFESRVQRYQRERFAAARPRAQNAARAAGRHAFTAVRRITWHPRIRQPP